jgi:hypothetical protein
VSRTLRFALGLIVACGDASEPSGGGSGGDAGGTGTGSNNTPPAGDSGGGGFLGSCDTRTNTGPTSGQCRDWTGKTNADLSVSCRGFNGAFSATVPCPIASRVGTCTIGPTLGAYAIYGYYEPDYTRERAEAHCKDLEGTFQP